MLKMYYLVSRKENFEEICVVDDSNKSNLPIEKTNVYPLGVFLSKLIAVFDSFSEPKYNEIISRDNMKSIFDNFVEESSSFYNELIEDVAVRRIFSMLLTEDYDMLGGERDRNSIGKILENCIPFIKNCQYEKEYLYPRLIELFLKSFAPMFPHHYDYVSNSFHNEFNVHISEENVKNALEFTISQEIKIESLRKNSRPLFPNKKRNRDYKNDRTLQTPLIVYEIRDVADLILATVKSILEQQLYLKQCRHCEKLFVASRWNVLYCPKPLNVRSSCKQIIKCENEQNTEHRRLHKIKRTSYINKGLNTTELYRKYMDAHTEKLKAYKRGELTESDLEDWIRNYKD